MQQIMQIDGRVAMRDRAFHNGADRHCQWFSPGKMRPNSSPHHSIRPTSFPIEKTRGGGPSSAKLLLPPSVIAKPADEWPTTVPRPAEPARKLVPPSLNVYTDVAFVHEDVGAGLHLG